LNCQAVGGFVPIAGRVSGIVVAIALFYFYCAGVTPKEFLLVGLLQPIVYGDSFGLEGRFVPLLWNTKVTIY
jgi:hypothetical protein